MTTRSVPELWTLIASLSRSADALRAHGHTRAAAALDDAVLRRASELPQHQRDKLRPR